MCRWHVFWLVHLLKATDSFRCPCWNSLLPVFAAYVLSFHSSTIRRLNSKTQPHYFPNIPPGDSLQFLVQCIHYSWKHLSSIIGTWCSNSLFVYAYIITPHVYILTIHLYVKHFHMFHFYTLSPKTYLFIVATQFSLRLYLRKFCVCYMIVAW